MNKNIWMYWENKPWFKKAVYLGLSIDLIKFFSKEQILNSGNLLSKVFKYSLNEINES